MEGDASFRRYGRLAGGPRPALLMDAPPAQEDVRPWCAVARHLGALGFSAPEILAAEESLGLLVIEDFGDDTFTRRLAGGADEAGLYDLAVDALVALHSLDAARAVPDWLPPYDDAKLIDEALLFTDWYLPALGGAPVSAAEREAYIGLWQEVLPLIRLVPATLVLRDYHVDNLMYIAGRDGVAACGLLDFQDAVAGPSPYDLVSLIEDARRDLGPGIAARALARYSAAFPDLAQEDFATAGAVLAAGRNAKIIGIFSRLMARDGKPGYLVHIPRVWRLLEADLTHLALHRLKAWFDRAVPAQSRVAPHFEETP
jgi:aminoglycoside/choline kinase family phosphotransferase